jgi:hypothetical protein
MKKITFAVASLFAASIANAGTYTYQPVNKDLSDLDHYYAYTWGIDSTIPQGERITSATLTIKNIWDWTVEDDILHVTLLDNPTSGVKSYYDNQGEGDFFAGQGTKVGTWTDTVGGRSRNFDLTFDLGQAGLLDKLNQYAKDGKFGFGFDPDCHYFNDGVSLTVHTQPVPEPATMAAMGLGIAALLKRRRK